MTTTQTAKGWLTTNIIVGWKLEGELRAAGINHTGVTLVPQLNSETLIEIDLVDIGQASSVAPVIDTHDGIDTHLQTRAGALAEIKLQQFASLTEAQLSTWFSNHLSDAQVDALGLPAPQAQTIKDQNYVLKQLMLIVRGLLNEDHPELLG